MIYQMKNMVNGLEEKVLAAGKKLCRLEMKKDEGVDGILVTVGLCVIALLLCVVMKDSLEDFVTDLVGELTKEAKYILSGVHS